MNINEAAKITCLSKKTLRFYEEKGLFNTQRLDNSYRDYSDENIECIKKITILRKIGVSISDILLLQNNIITLNEVIRKRIKILQDDQISNIHQLEICNCLLKTNFTLDQMTLLSDDKSIIMDNGEDPESILYNNDYSKNIPVSIGVDIGTSTISIAVTDNNGKKLDVYNIPNNANIKGEPWEHLQDPEIILNSVMLVLNIICNTHLNILCIAVTGQMHGILYVDKKGNSVSPLHTWIDKSADQLIDGKESYSDQIARISNFKIPTGYGIATHYYLMKNNKLPAGAYKFCTIMDYITMKLAGTNVPYIHPTNAASLGGFDIATLKFSQELNKIIDVSYLPTVVSDNYICGKYLDKIDVKPAIGDHQACFLGANFEDEAIHINIGTGSQISVCSNDYENKYAEIEVRPYFDGKYLKCYSALSGGLSYSIMEKFLRKIVYVATGKDESQYLTMDRLINESLNGDPPIVNTQFCGTRNDPYVTGSIQNLTMDNFDPGLFIIGIMNGIVDELYDKSKLIFEDNCKNICISGNAVRKNKHLVKIIKDKFKCDVHLFESPEEAALGAAIFALKKSC